MSELYVSIMSECPQCGGEGRLETMTGLTYDGSQSWRIETCNNCDGDRQAWVRVKCQFCHEEILESESALDEGSVCHASCLAESRPTPRALDVCPACAGSGEWKTEGGCRVRCEPCKGTGQRQ